MEERSADAAAKRAKKEEDAKNKLNQQAQKDARQRRGVAQLAEMKIRMELEDDEDEANFRKQRRRGGASDDDYGNKDQDDEDDEMVVDEEDGPANVPKKVRLRRRTRVLYVTVLTRTRTKLPRFPLSALPHLHLQLSKKQKNRLKGSAITRAIDEQAKNIHSNGPTAARYVSIQFFQTCRCDSYCCTNADTAAARINVGAKKSLAKGRSSKANSAFEDDWDGSASALKPTKYVH